MLLSVASRDSLSPLTMIYDRDRRGLIRIVDGKELLTSSIISLEISGESDSQKISRAWPDDSQRVAGVLPHNELCG
jgi:hypothetical protein